MPLTTRLRAGVGSILTPMPQGVKQLLKPPDFGLKQEAHLRWMRDRSRVNWEAFVRYQVRANETYLEAKRQFSDRNRDVVTNVQSAHKWWSTLKSAVFG